MSNTDLLIVVAVVAIAVVIDVIPARWAVKGTGRGRIVAGALIAWVVTTIVGLVVYLLALSILRRKEVAEGA